MSTWSFASQELEDPFVLPTFKERLDCFHKMMVLMVQNMKDSENIKKMADFDPMTYDQFYDSVQNLFNYELKTECIRTVYKKINNHLDALVDWTELFGYFPSDGQNLMKESPIFLLSKRQCIEQREGERRRRDHIQSIINVPQLDQVVAATQKGIILLYNSQMKLQTYTSIGDISQVSGCDYLSQLKRIVTVTETSIIIWDHKPKTKNQTNFFTLKPMQNIMLCICSVTLSESTGEDNILIGDDAGFVNLLVVGNEDLNLQKSKDSNALQSQVLDPHLLRRPILRRKLHSEWVLRVKYFSHLNSFVSSSSDSVHSVALDDIRKLGDCQPIRTLSVPRGVNAFDYCVKANTFVTGGEDKIVRLWNPNMFSKAKALLVGHNCIITEVVINEADQHIISLSTEGMFRVWDIQTIAILQIFILGEHKVDRHFNTMVFDNKNKRLIVGSTSIDLVPLTSAVQDNLKVPLSHEQSINVLVFNKTSGKVVSICSKSIIKVWKLENGKKIYQIAHPHGQSVQVTAAVVDERGIYLVTGATDGSLIIWELYGGEKIRSLPPVTEINGEDKRISQLFFLSCDEPRLVLAVGSNNMMKVIQDGPDESSLSVLGTFPNVPDAIYNSSLFPMKRFQSTSGQSDLVKQGNLDDIELSGIDIMDCITETLLVIGWSNLIILWNFDNTHILQIFNEDRLLDTSDRSDKNDLIQGVESAKVQVVKFIALRVKINEPETLGITTDSQSQISSITLNDTSKISLMFRYAESVTPSEYSQTEANSPMPASNDELLPTILPPIRPNLILLSAHQDGSIQFWNMEGVQLHKILPTIQLCSPITTVLVTDGIPHVIAGNQRGYIMIWDIEAFFNDPYAENKEPINRVISWRAHILQIVSIFFVEEASVVVSASIDCSVRVWYALNGHYIGYFGQHSVLSLMNPSEFVLPSDITEVPVEGKSKQSNKVDQLDYPMILDWERWKPFDREGYLMKQKQQWKVLDEDKKFFKAVTIPRIDPLFQINPFKDTSFSAEGDRDSLHNIFSGEKKATISNIKKDAKGSTLQSIQTCNIFNATTAPPPYTML
ncbi:WD repeat-containing protein 64-like isoform X2 [Narcine bancroftii]|uniref:WD repeat-containing protein 64-like isoform X2 n=1 Tax=Narcine bancroftii TaxID=1343680 RepID=UPI003831FDEA